MSTELVMPSSNFILCTPFSSCLQSFPASNFPMSRLFASGGQVVELQLQHQSFQRISRFDFLAVQRETVTDFISFGYYWRTHNSTLQREELALEHSLPPSRISLTDYFHATQIRSFLLLAFPPSLPHLEAWWIQRRPENSEAVRWTQSWQQICTRAVKDCCELCEWEIEDSGNKLQKEGSRCYEKEIKGGQV